MYPLLKVCDQASFESCDLNVDYAFVVSIQNKGVYPAVLRPDFRGRRIDLYFDDVVEGPTAPRPIDIEALFAFARDEWLPEVRRNFLTFRTIIHCGAGVSRSGAAALLLLSLYFGSYAAAAIHLYRTAPQVAPNALMCRLIFEKLGPAYGPDIFAALAEGKAQAT